MDSGRSFDIFTEDELERFVRATGENDFVDAKAPCKWNGDTKAELAKDFAAFANSAGGGAVVIGKAEKKDKTFDWIGLSEEERLSFDTTHIAQWVNSRFSPGIRLVCSHIQVDAKWFVVIGINEFAENPVICTKNYGANGNKLILKEGSIYIRSSNAASMPLTNAEQLSGLIRRAVLKHKDQLRILFDAVLSGQTAANIPTDEEHFSMLAEIVENDILSSPQERHASGGWRFIIHPDSYSDKWDSVTELSKFVGECQLINRRFPQQNINIRPHEWGIEGTYNLWAMTYKGLFYFWQNYHENSMDWKSQYVGDQTIITRGKWVNLSYTIHDLINFFAFASSYAAQFDPGVQLRFVISAFDLKGRHLLDTATSDSLMGMGFEPCAASRFTSSNTLAAGKLISNWENICTDTVKKFVDLFPGAHSFIHRRILADRVKNNLGRDN